MNNNLFETVKLGNLELQNRVVMPPMTRSRTIEGDVPSDVNAKYYSERASAGLIIAEATQISLQGQGYSLTPGIYTDEQVKGWKIVTDAVHAKGGKIFLQLWHVGRVSNHHVNGMQPVAPSAISAKDTNVYVMKNGEAKFLATETPRELSVEEIHEIVKDYVSAAKNAIKAGFDGVEIHGGNGYLIDQFLRSNSNKRTDEYGGNISNRVRFVLEVTKAVVAAVGADKTGVRLAPFITAKDMGDPEILSAITLAAKGLNDIGTVYLHLSEADFDDAPEIPDSFRIDLRKAFRNTIIATGRYNLKRAQYMLATDWVDMIGFGRLYIANPDLVERFKNDGPYNKLRAEGWFGGNEIGFNDYPSL
ncbi:MAG: alkene reductase [Flavobacteriales bacterium]|nr:alkene reductase [Flavobacteriales bacterium]